MSHLHSGVRHWTHFEIIKCHSCAKHLSWQQSAFLTPIFIQISMHFVYIKHLIKLYLVIYRILKVFTYWLSRFWTFFLIYFYIRVRSHSNQLQFDIHLVIHWSLLLCFNNINMLNHCSSSKWLIQTFFIWLQSLIARVIFYFICS